MVVGLVGWLVVKKIPACCDLEIGLSTPQFRQFFNPLIRLPDVLGSRDLFCLVVALLVLLGLIAVLGLLDLLGLLALHGLLDLPGLVALFGLLDLLGWFSSLLFDFLGLLLPCWLACFT